MADSLTGAGRHRDRLLIAAKVCSEITMSRAAASTIDVKPAALIRFDGRLSAWWERGRSASVIVDPLTQAQPFALIGDT
ncbi:hypothetical protein AB0D32_32130 [Micromonospora sp. NPDC048170]|uniref:hypothetical protein n=1 Tax=Micromonospora sp. NPDC048170 TaxID=3154819 RepID=UPI0033FF26A3